MLVQEKQQGNLRPDVVAVHSLDHFAFSVPDLAVAKTFYMEFGLDVREVGDTLELYTFGHAHRWGLVRKGERKKLDYLSFGVFEDDVQPFLARFKEHGLALIDPPAGAPSNGIWIRNPDGIALEIRVAEKTSPDEKSRFDVTSVGPGLSGTVSRTKAPRVYPRRLSHFLMFSSDVLRDIAFYRDVLGLKLSDHSGGIVAFLHGAHGSDHHLLALAGSNGPGMHHSSWDVGTVQEVGLGASHMAEVGYDRGWGLGRHVLGANYFHYVRDPWGSYAEYSCDIDYIPAGHEWPAADHDPGDSFYLWGPQPPEGFVTNYEAEDA
jgi:catechol 2,3-dioxygenase-like lactoylglutathione lyase family enzyme